MQMTSTGCNFCVTTAQNTGNIITGMHPTPIDCAPGTVIVVTESKLCLLFLPI